MLIHLISSIMRQLNLYFVLFISKQVDGKLMGIGHYGTGRYGTGHYGTYRYGTGLYGTHCNLGGRYVKFWFCGGFQSDQEIDQEKTVQIVWGPAPNDLLYSLRQPTLRDNREEKYL